MTADGGSRVADCIDHMLDAIGRIEAYTQGLELASFRASALVQDAVIRNFEVVGEAAFKIRTADSSFADAHPELKLDLAYRMRNA